MTLSERTKITPALAYAAGTADRTGVAIDARGFDRVQFLLSVHAVAGSGHVGRIQGSNDGVTWTNLSGVTWMISTVHVGTGQAYEIVRPACRYLRLSIDKNGTDATAESAVAIRGGANSEPTTWTSGDLERWQKRSPALSA